MDNTLTINTEYKFYSRAQVVVAAFIGGPFAGGLYFAKVMRFFGQEDAANTALRLSIGATLFLAVVVFYLPDNFPSAALPAAYCGLYSSYMAQFMKKHDVDAKAYASHKGSWGKLIMVSIALLVLMFGLIIATFYALDMTGMLPPGVSTQP